MKAEAERVRLEAELMEQRLTLTKIQRLEKKLGNKDWLAKHPEEEENIERQIQALQQKLVVNPAETVVVSSVPSNLTSVDAIANTTDASSVRQAEVVEAKVETPKATRVTTSPESLDAAASQTSSTSSKQSYKRDENPLSGFDDDDLKAYLPVARRIEARMPNSTLDELLVAFRAEPDLQEHFQKKIKAMILQPMEDMQKLEELRSQFLYTRSRVEKENLRRQIAQMEKDLDRDGPFGYSESIFANIPRMSEEEREKRIQAVSALPKLMQGLYTRRTKAPDGEIRLAIELDHYETQIQLLEQIKYINPWTTELRDEAIMALESLTPSVRSHLAQTLGLEECNDTQEILNELIKTQSDPLADKEWSSMQELVVAAGGSSDETDDLDYLDRSRYAEEFFPSIARMEGKHPSLDEMNDFIQDVVDRQAFMVQSKPERVVGGWYLRGENLLSDDEDGTKLVNRLMERLEDSPKLAEKIEFFYIPDPSPLSDEDFEMEIPGENLLYITGKDPSTFYNNASLFTKLSVSTLGIAAIALFSIGTVGVVPALQERLDSALSNGNDDLEWLTSIVTPTFLSTLGIYAVHEMGHVIISLRDKFKIGFGTPLASIQTGFFGSITPLRSPPPSLKSMFDFAMAGPALGFLASLALFVTGLQETAATEMNASLNLPGLPTYLLRSSALCSELVEFYLGKGTLLSGVSLPPEAILPLHPFAIAGYVGLIVNALALLPIGSKFDQPSSSFLPT